MDLRTAARELYGELPTDFIATRTRLVREARTEGDRELATAIGALPKPTVAAWAVNLLVRVHGEDVQRLLAVGAQVREVQASGSAEGFRALNRIQRDLLAAARRQAEAVAREAGVLLSEPVAQRVQATLHAAMADPWVAEAVRSGVLVTDVASTGLGPVDISGAVAVGVGAATGTLVPQLTPDPTGAKKAGGGVGSRAASTRTPTGDADEVGGGPSDRGRAAREPAERAAEGAGGHEAERQEAARRAAEEAHRRAESLAVDAEAAADAARSRLADAEATLEGLAREAAERDEEVAALTARLRELRAEQTSAVVRERRARAGRDQAARALGVAERAAARARAAVPAPPERIANIAADRELPMFAIRADVRDPPA